MSQSVEKPKLNKGQRVKELRDYHLPVFEAMGVPHAFYSPKMFYTPSGKSELHVSFFISEMQKGQSIFTEMVDRDYVSEDVSRTLYKWEFNQFWESQYEKTPMEPIRVLIPVSELNIVKPKSVIKQVSQTIEEELMDGCTEDDCDITSMTIRDFAAIMLKAPVSHKEWLNKLITQKT